MPFNLLFSVEYLFGSKDLSSFKEDPFSFEDKWARNKRDNRTAVAITCLTTLYWVAGATWPAIALAQSNPETIPAPAAISNTEIPEEILRTEIITEARSPLTGEPMSAADYAQLQAELSDPTRETVTISEDLRYLVFLLQIRRAVKPIVPFL